MANEELKQHISAFLRDYSIEITPHDTGKLDAIRAELTDGAVVYVAHPPGVPIDDIVALAGSVQKLGLTATPHIIARKLESREQLERALARCQELGIHNALCVAGDITADKPAYDSSLEVLQTGLFAKYGFREVGVAGHPEGSKAIGEERVDWPAYRQRQRRPHAVQRFRDVDQPWRGPELDAGRHQRGEFRLFDRRARLQELRLGLR